MQVQPTTLQATRNLIDPFQPKLKGQLTFDAEGTNRPGRFYSRVLHWPGGASGVTIGRGYDMKFRSPAQVAYDLMRAGVDRHTAGLYSKAAGLEDEAAKAFTDRHREVFPELTAKQERALFELVTYPQAEADVVRIMKKSDLVAKYGKSNWQSFPQPIKDLIVDLRYRGDYTPTTRRALQPLLVAEDWNGVRQLFSNTAYWRAIGVPNDRIKRRAEFANEMS